MRVRIPSFLMLAALSLAACSQSKGDPCQVNGDCSSGLLCCAGDSPRGVCTQGPACPGAVRDASTSEPDASSDGEDAGESN
jgi:hypothetical protein